MLQRVITQPDNYAPFLLSQGIRHGNLLFISGQAAPATTEKSFRAAFWPKGSKRSRICGARWKRAAPA